MSIETLENTLYEIGKTYCFNDNWKFIITNTNTVDEIERIRKHKIVMLTGQMSYEFQGNTQDYVSCPLFMPISLLSYSPRKWELDENYILPFEDANESYPNNPDGTSSSFRVAEAEMYYDIKINIDTFPFTDNKKEKELKMPYVLITNIKQLRLLNKDKIWLEIAWKSDINKGHEDFQAYEKDDVPIWKLVRSISIPLKESYASHVLEGIQEIENMMMHSNADVPAKFSDFVLENIGSPFLLKMIAKHIYTGKAANLRYSEDVDSNKNLKDFIVHEIETCKMYPPKKILIFNDLMEMKNPLNKNDIERRTEYYGIFSYQSNDKIRGGNSTTPPEERLIKIPLIFMQTFTKYSYE